jgi:hypothetical protein
MKLPLIGNLSRNKSIAIGVALAFLTMMVVVPFGGADDMTEPFADATTQSAISGNFNAYSRLQTATGEVVWSTDGGDDIIGEQSILDLATGVEVSQCVMGVNWVATGTELDWNTLHVWGRYWFWSYQGNGGGKEYRQVLEDGDVLFTTMTTEADGSVVGGLEYAPANIEAHMPDTVIMIFWEYDEVTGTKSSFTEEYPQKTGEAHPMTFVYRAQYWVEVNDLYGNKYSGEYTQHTELNLQWSGTSFEIDWGGETATGTVTTSQSPSIDPLADYSTPSGTVLSLVWAPRDTNPASYEVTVDGVLKASGLWTGGDIPFSTKYADGVHTVVCTVKDTDGNKASDTVEVAAYTELDSDVLGGTEPSEPTDATGTFDTGTTDYSASDPAASMSLIGDMVGSQEGIILLAAIAGAVLIGYKTGISKKLGEKLKRVWFRLKF